MSPPSFFRRKKKEEKTELKVEKKAGPEEKTLLEQLCGEDTELYGALSRTLLLNPAQALEEGMDSYVKRARESEEQGDARKARIMYQMAGQIALYEGKTDEVETFFKKCADTETSPEMKKVFEFYTKKKNLDKALKIAKEYYARTSAPTEKKE